jgi:hypothetical protein
VSIKAMNTVWESALTPPSLKLAALALADWSNDEGGSLYPSMKAIAKKVGVSKSQAQRLVHTLVDLGLLSVLANGAGGAPGETPHYQMSLDRIAAHTGSTDATGSTHATGRANAARGVAPMRQTGSTHATQTTIEPSIEPSDAPKPARRLARLPCPADQIRLLYGEVLPELPAIKVWTSKRQMATKARWDEMAKARNWATSADGLTWFRRFFEIVAAADFLMGRGERKPGHEGWRCDFDFLMTPAKFVGVIEGKYTNREAA